MPDDFWSDADIIDSYYPVAMTAMAFCRYVSPLEGDDEKFRRSGCQPIHPGG